jgi:hypothetical protein
VELVGGPIQRFVLARVVEVEDVLAEDVDPADPRAATLELGHVRYARGRDGGGRAFDGGGARSAEQRGADPGNRELSP